jgi:hypothetical protein
MTVGLTGADRTMYVNGLYLVLWVVNGTIECWHAEPGCRQAACEH